MERTRKSYLTRVVTGRNSYADLTIAEDCLRWQRQFISLSSSKLEDFGYPGTELDEFE